MMVHHNDIGLGGALACRHYVTVIHARTILAQAVLPSRGGLGPDRCALGYRNTLGDIARCCV